MPSPIDPVRALLREHAHQILAAAARQVVPAGPLAVTAGDDALTITLILAPAGTKAGRSLTRCEVDVLAILEAASCRLSRHRVLDEAARLGLPHGASTIGRALTRLVKIGLVRSSRRAPRGYYLPGKSYALFTAPVRS